jgi:hypothetical protein
MHVLWPARKVFNCLVFQMATAGTMLQQTLQTECDNEGIKNESAYSDY